MSSSGMNAGWAWKGHSEFKSEAFWEGQETEPRLRSYVRHAGDTTQRLGWQGAGTGRWYLDEAGQGLNGYLQGRCGAPV